VSADEDGLHQEGLEEFHRLVESRLGLTFDDSRSTDLADALRQRVKQTGCDGVAAYLRSLRNPSACGKELRVLAGRLTVRETHFFRNPDHFRALFETVLPDRLAASEPRQVRLLSAGTATGEEAYTMAILAREKLGETAPSRVAITGIDISADALAHARAARYGTWALRGTPPDLLQRHFDRAGSDAVLRAWTRDLVSFQERNLMVDDAEFWAAGAFDVIFCRNVFIYMSPEAIQSILGRLTRALSPGGFLFLGHSENLRGLSRDFHLRHSHDTFYYQRHSGTEAARGQDDGWFSAIGRSSSRVESLSALARATELFRRERFDAAMDLLRAAPSSGAADPDALLLEAVILTNRGATREAEQICRRVLAAEELSAGAHYLLALGREQAGDATEAERLARTALYLDPTFAMPRLLLARLARVAGRREEARRELEQARWLLDREDTSRILLFGGGFQRAGLVQVCAAGLRSLEGAA